MPLDGARDFLDRLQARSDRPAVPAIEHELGPVSGGATVDEREPDPIGARRTWRPPPSTAPPGRVPALTDRYRAWSLLVPSSPLSCRRPRGRQEQALTGARSSRVLDRHSTRRRIQRAAGPKGWLCRTEQKDGTKAQKALFAVPGHPFTAARRLFLV